MNVLMAGRAEVNGQPKEVGGLAVGSRIHMVDMREAYFVAEVAPCHLFIILRIFKHLLIFMITSLSTVLHYLIEKH